MLFTIMLRNPFRIIGVRCTEYIQLGKSVFSQNHTGYSQKLRKHIYFTHTKIT